MINLLFEDKFHANVFQHFNPKCRKDGNYYNEKLDRVTSYEICLLEDIRLISPSDDTDFFVYPIFLNEPYYHIRHFINPDHPSFGIMSMIEESIATRINKGKGVIYLSMTYEPPNYQELITACNVLNGDKRFIVNIMYPELVQDNIYCLPGHIEALENDEPPEKRSQNGIDDQAHPVTTQKDFAFLNRRTEKHVAACISTYYLDHLKLLDYANYSFNEDMKEAYNIAKQHRISNHLFENFIARDLKGDTKPKSLLDTLTNSTLNLVVEAYYERLSLDKPFFSEKIWRNIWWEKPFVLIGQRKSLEKLRQLGYKTFHPFIDETYDISSDEVRLFKAIQQVKKFVKLSESEKIIFLDNLKPIFIHNKNNFRKRIQKLNSVLENARYQ